MSVRDKDFKPQGLPATTEGFKVEGLPLRPKEDQETLVVSDPSMTVSSELIFDVVHIVFETHDWCDAKEAKAPFPKTDVEVAKSLREIAERVDSLPDSQVKEELQALVALAAMRSVVMLIEIARTEQ